MARFAIAATLLLLSLSGTAAASPTWLSSFPISDAGQAAHRPQVAVDGEGGVLVAWLRPAGMSARVEARYRPPGGEFGPVETVSDPGATGLRLAVGEDGTGVAVWIRGGRVEAAVRPSGASFGPASPISPPGEGAHEPQVATDGAGTATAAWASTAGETHRIRVATRPPGGSFGAALEIESRTDTLDSGFGSDWGLDNPRVAADPSGRAYLVYREVEFQYLDGDSSPDGVTYQGWVHIRQPGGTFGGKLGLSPHSSHIDEFEIAAGSNGTAAVAWADGSNDSIAVRVRPPQGPFGPIESPVDLPSGSTEPRFPDLAVAPSGEIAATWQVDVPGPDDSIGADVRSVGSFFPDNPETLSEADVDARLPRVAVDGDGVFHVAWHRRGGVPRLLSARRAPGGGFGSPVAISPPGQNTLDPSELDVEADQEGNAVAVWARNHEGGDRIEVAGHDGAAPSFLDLSIPGSGEVDSPLSFSASVFDTWSSTSIDWDFGDGGTGEGSTTSHSFDSPGSYSVSATATDAVGNETTRSGTVSPEDTQHPRIARLRFLPQRFRVGRRATPIVATSQRRRRKGARRRRARVGTQVRYALSEEARVVLVFQRALRGVRLRSGRCVKPTRRRARRGKRCVRFVRAGRPLRRASHTGLNRFRFTGRIRRRPLRPGRYRAIAWAIDPSGNRSETPARSRFLIVRR